MPKLIFSALLGISLLLTMYSCNKNDSSPDGDKVVDVDSGSFLALVDSTIWHPAFHSASYYSQWNQLFISAADSYAGASSTFSLSGGVNLDSANLLKKYPLLPNGENTFKLIYKGSFYSDPNIIDAGGSFTLTKFDTVRKTISGILEFTGYDIYSKNSTKKVKFSTTKLEDLPLKIDTRKYSGNNASCIVQGVTTTNRESKNLYARVACATGPVPTVTNEGLTIDINSILSEGSIYIRMPVTKNIGKYVVYPEVAPYNYYCNKYVVSVYTDGRYYKKYQAVTGELNVLSIDSLNRKIEATFNIQYRDTVTKETINVSNGKISLKTFVRLGE